MRVILIHLGALVGIYGGVLLLFARGVTSHGDSINHLGLIHGDIARFAPLRGSSTIFRVGRVRRKNDNLPKG